MDIMARTPSPLATSRARFRNRLGVWSFATVFIVVFPLFPIFVELVKTGGVKPESYLLTAAVLAVVYGFTSQHPVSWALYGLIFFGSLVYDFNAAVLPSPGWPQFLAGFEAWIAHHFALFLVLLVTVFHTLERFLWHVVRDQLFPDWRRE
jgi:hypothetical protein